jgi:hypothetical protein
MKSGDLTVGKIAGDLCFCWSFVGFSVGARELHDESEYYQSQVAEILHKG